MTNSDSLPYDAALEEYQRQADALVEELKTGSRSAAHRFKWMHPRFRGKPAADPLASAPLDLADAQLVVALEYSFASWPVLAEFTEAVRRNGPIKQFETAVEAVVAGDLETLRTKLRDDPGLVRARSTRRHHATLFHYIGANGVESGRQKTPANAVEVAKALLDAGADVDALADLYDGECTTMSMLVSSCHPANAGLQVSLAETLLDYGAALVGPGSKWPSALMTALEFGYLDAAEALARRGAPVDSLSAIAGLGRMDDLARLLPTSDRESRHAAMALAAQHGHTNVVRLLLDAGEDASRFNPEGHHPHSTPLHQAVCSNHINVFRLLVERGARMDILDTIYQATPLDWAIHCGRTEIADYLRSRGALAT
jgi:ankyrin repeat protein